MIPFGYWDKDMAKARVDRLMKRLDEFVVEEAAPKTYEQLITREDALFAHEIGVGLW